MRMLRMLLLMMMMMMMVLDSGEGDGNDDDYDGGGGTVMMSLTLAMKMGMNMKVVKMLISLMMMEMMMTIMMMRRMKLMIWMMVVVMLVMMMVMMVTKILAMVILRMMMVMMVIMRMKVTTCNDPTFDGDLNDSSLQHSNFNLHLGLSPKSTPVVAPLQFCGPSSHLTSIKTWMVETLGETTYQLGIGIGISIHSIFHLGWRSPINWGSTSSPWRKTREAPAGRSWSTWVAREERTPMGFIGDEWHTSGSV